MNQRHSFWKKTTEGGYSNPVYEKYQRIFAYTSLALLILGAIIIMFYL